MQDRPGEVEDAPKLRPIVLLQPAAGGFGYLGGIWLLGVADECCRAYTRKREANCGPNGRPAESRDCETGLCRPQHLVDRGKPPEVD
jgi:hypothetical protein